MSGRWCARHAAWCLHGCEKRCRRHRVWDMAAWRWVPADDCGCRR